MKNERAGASFQRDSGWRPEGAKLLLGLVLALLLFVCGAPAAKADPTPVAPGEWAADALTPTGAVPATSENGAAAAANPAAQAASKAEAPAQGIRAHLLPGLLLGLLLGLAALHLARQVYTEAPGSLAASSLLVAAFAFEYVSFGLHVPFVGDGHWSALLQALVAAGLAAAALSFLSGYLELPTAGGALLWGSWGLLGYAGFVALFAIFNARFAVYGGELALALAALWSAGLAIWLGRRGDERASYLVPGLLLVVSAVAAAAGTKLGLLPGGAGASLAHALFVIGLLLVAFAVESVETPPERTYLALPAPSPMVPPEAPAITADPAAQPAPAFQGPRAASDLILARVSERRLALALAASRHGLWDWNITQNRIAISPETENLLGLDPGAFDGSEDTWLDCIEAEDQDEFRSGMARAVDEGESVFALNFRIHTADGERRAVTLDGACLNPGPDGRATRCIGLIMRREEGTSVPAAPPLTAAPAQAPAAPLGRAALIQTLDERLAPEGRPETGAWLLLLIDLDRFHTINESFGHAIGDRVLDVIAGRLKAGLSADEAFIVLSGDEFALILHDGLGKPPRGVRADRLIGLIGRPVPLDDGREVFASASIGLVPLDGMPGSGAAALKDAETALFHVKRTGGGRYAIYAPEMREKTRLSATLESELRRALEREEIELHYQPIMALADGRISGFEALIRWRHAEHGILTADTFVDLAEKTGLIVPLGKYALAMASVQLYQWQSFYPLIQPLFVCVNVSSRQLLRHDLVTDVRNVLSAVSLAPNSLRLEVNEQLVADDAAGAKVVLEELKALGAGIALDDFGTGYASIGMLQQLPIDTLKVDKSFIARLREPDEKMTVVRSIVDLAHDLNMDVIAEGIESETDVRRLRALGCEFGEGFFFGQPMPPDDIQGFIARYWSN